MICRICALDSKKVRDAVEIALLEGDGMIFQSKREELMAQFPEYAEKIGMISDQDCSLHFNFHQTISRLPKAREITAEDPAAKNGASLASDIGKDEAAVLYEVLNAQAATFNVLNTRIVNQIKDAEKEDGTKLLLHPTTIQFYKEVADSVRATVRAIGDLNLSLNGQKDSSLDGLLALAKVLDGSRNKEEQAKTHPQDNPADGTTTMFDD